VEASKELAPRKQKQGVGFLFSLSEVGMLASQTLF